MTTEQILAERYLTLMGGIPKAPKTLTVQIVNAGAWGHLPVLMSEERAEAMEQATIRPVRRAA